MRIATSRQGFSPARGHEAAYGHHTRLQGHGNAALVAARLRHRRISLLVLRGTPIPRVSAFVGHARGSMTLDTYSHVLLKATELEYADLLVYV